MCLHFFLYELIKIGPVLCCIVSLFYVIFILTCGSHLNGGEGGEPQRVKYILHKLSLQEY